MPSNLCKQRIIKLILIGFVNKDITGAGKGEHLFYFQETGNVYVVNHSNKTYEKSNKAHKTNLALPVKNSRTSAVNNICSLAEFTIK